MTSHRGCVYVVVSIPARYGFYHSFDYLRNQDDLPRSATSNPLILGLTPPLPMVATPYSVNSCDLDGPGIIAALSQIATPGKTYAVIVPCRSEPCLENYGPYG